MTLPGEDPRDRPLPAEGCIPADVVAAFRAGRLGQHEADAACEHAAGCPRCEASLAAASVSPACEAMLDIPLPALDDVRAESLVRANEELPLHFLGPPREPGDRGTLGGYRVLDVIGHGGSAIVLKAWDDELDIPVAIKVLKDRGDQLAVRRFMGEARAAGRFKEVRQLVRVLRAEPSHDPPYFTMDYVPGVTLDGTVGRAGRLDPRAAARIALEVAHGLARMHKEGWVHQDIKPGNIVVPHDAGRQRTRLARAYGWFAGRDPSDTWAAKILDLGLAFPVSGRTGRPLGYTPAYASPEQKRRNATVGTASDVFSLGATLFEMLVGDAPRTREERRVREFLHRSGTPRTLADICVACLRKNPRERPSAEDVARRLAAFLGRPRRVFLRGMVLAVGLAAVLSAGMAYREYRARRAAAAEVNRVANRLGDLGRRVSDLLQGLQMERALLLVRAGELAQPGEETRPLGEKHVDPERQRDIERIREILGLLEQEPDLRADGRIDIIVRNARAAIAVAYGQFEEALHELPSEVVDSLPARTDVEARIAQEARLARARALEGSGRWAAAARYYRETEWREPFRFLPLWGLTNCLYRLGRKEEAVGELIDAIERLPAEAGRAHGPGVAAVQLAMAHLRLATIAVELAEDRRGLALDEVGSAVKLLESVRDHGDDKVTPLLIAARIIEATLLLELGNAARGIHACALALDERDRLLAAAGEWGLRSAEAGFYLRTIQWFVQTLEKEVDRLSGTGLGVARFTLLRATVERGYTLLRLEAYVSAARDADRSLAMVDEVPAGAWDDRWRGIMTFRAYRLRMLARQALADAAEADGQADSARRYAGQALADADRVVEVAEALGKARAGAERDTGDLVVEAILAKTLTDRGLLLAREGHRVRAIADIDRAVTILDRLARSGVTVVRPALDRAMESRGEVVSGRLPSRVWEP